MIGLSDRRDTGMRTPALSMTLIDEIRRRRSVARAGLRAAMSARVMYDRHAHARERGIGRVVDDQDRYGCSLRLRITRNSEEDCERCESRENGAHWPILAAKLPSRKTPSDLGLDLVLRRAGETPIRIQPLPRVPVHRHRAYSLELDARVIRLNQRQQSTSGEQEPARGRLQCVEHRPREVRL